MNDFDTIRDPKKLIQAARTAICLVTIVQETLWELFPNELLLLKQSDENHLVDAISQALRSLPADPIDDIPF